MEPVQRNLAGLTPMGRQAFLLVAMEELSISDAAKILHLGEEETGLLLEEAHQDNIASQIATDVVIIEDVPLIAMDLQYLVEGLGRRFGGRDHRIVMDVCRDVASKVASDDREAKLLNDLAQPHASAFTMRRGRSA
jgi:hypothetical protein